MATTPTADDLLTADQAARILRLSPVRVRVLCREGRLGRRIGRQYVITRGEAEAFARIPRISGNPNFKRV